MALRPRFASMIVDMPINRQRDKANADRREKSSAGVEREIKGLKLAGISRHHRFLQLFRRRPFQESVPLGKQKTARGDLFTPYFASLFTS